MYSVTIPLTVSVTTVIPVVKTPVVQDSVSQEVIVTTVVLSRETVEVDMLLKLIWVTIDE